MLKQTARWLLVAVSVLAINHAAHALSAQKQKDSSSSQKPSGDKAKDAKNTNFKNTDEGQGQP